MVLARAFHLISNVNASMSLRREAKPVPPDVSMRRSTEAPGRTSCRITCALLRLSERNCQIAALKTK